MHQESFCTDAGHPQIKFTVIDRTVIRHETADGLSWLPKDKQDSSDWNDARQVPTIIPAGMASERKRGKEEFHIMNERRKATEPELPSIFAFVTAPGPPDEPKAVSVCA